MVRVKPDYASYRRKPIRGPLFQKRCSTDPAIPLSITVPGREWNATDGTPERRPVAEFRCGILPPHPGARFRTRCRRVAPEEIVMKTTQYVRQEKSIASADSGKGFDTTWYVEQEHRIAEATVRSALARRQVRAMFDPGHLYVVEFDSGVVKVGKTINAESRLAAHEKAGLIRRSWASPRHLHCGETERQLIAFCNEYGQLHGGREYFRDLDTEAARAYAALVVRNALRRAYLDDLIEAVDNDLSATWQQAQERLDADGAS